MRLTMPQRLVTDAPAGSLFKRPREMKIKSSLGRSPRQRDEEHLSAIRQLPCIKCGLEPCEAAHVRQNSSPHGKRTGIGEKPDDKWTIPACRDCHREQHQEGELTFWHSLGLNPLLICEALYAASPDIVRMRAVVLSFMAQRT